MVIGVHSGVGDDSIHEYGLERLPVDLILFFVCFLVCYLLVIA